MGGGTKIVQPETPTPPTAGESAAEYAAAMPQIYETNLQYQPLFDVQQLESYRNLAPQYAQLNQDVMQQFQPKQFALGEQLAGQASEMAQNGLTPGEMDLYKNQYKSLVGNQVNAPVGGNFVAKNLLEQQMQAKQVGRNMGLSLSGRMPITQAQQPMSQFQVAPSFGQAFGTQMGGYGAYAQASRPMAIQQPNYLAGAGSIMSGIGSFGSFMPH